MPDNFANQSAESMWRKENENWILVERYCERYPHDWRLVFRKGETILEIQVPEEVWRAFDGIKFTSEEDRS